ncbi:MAG: DUF3613 domain-containing protein [Nevskia sp.]|nr:DUF3613 domain-containing protein [Nevskia sp.]
MRATILLTAMLIAGASHAESPADSSTSASTAACPCAETSTIDLGAAPEPEKVVTLAPAGAAATPSKTGFGASSRSWVDLQASGTAASVTARPLPGDAASNAYERYANSFKQPIPESFKRESFSADQGGN